MALDSATYKIIVKDGEPSTLAPDEVGKINQRLEYLSAEQKQIIADRDEAKRKLKEFQDADAAKKNADLTEVDKAKAAVTELTKQIEEARKDVAKYKEYETTKRGEIKTELGDQWDPSFEILELNGLERLRAKLTAAKPTPQTKPGEGNVLPVKYEEAMSNSGVMTELLKHPELHQKLERDWIARGRPGARA